MKVKSESEVAQFFLTLSNPMDCSLSGSSIHGIFQARVLEWGAIAFSEGRKIHSVNFLRARSSLGKTRPPLHLRGFGSVNLFKARSLIIEGMLSSDFMV